MKVIKPLTIGDGTTVYPEVGGADIQPWYEITFLNRTHSSIAFGNGRFVIGDISGSDGGNATAQWSSDYGSTWNAAATAFPSFGYSLRICFGAGLFFADVNFADSAYSADGDTWTVIPAGGVSGSKGPWFGNGLFFVTSGASFNTWTLAGGWGAVRSTGLPPNYIGQGGAYGLGLYVMCGWSGACWSSDLVTWTAGTVAGGGDNLSLESIAFGNGTFVALLADQGQHRNYAYSADGKNWTVASLPLDRIWYKVLFSNGKFLACARNFGSENGSILAYSSDGISWTSTTPPAVFTWTTGFTHLAADESNHYVAMSVYSNTFGNASIPIPGRPTTPVGDLYYSDIAEPTASIDPSAWIPGSSYSVGSTVSLVSTHKVYQAITNISTGDTTSPHISVQLAIPKWLEIGSTNKFAMFDLYRNTPSIFTTDTIIPRTVTGTTEIVNSAIVSVDVVNTDNLSIALLNLVNVGRVIVQCVDNITSSIISTTSYDINIRDVYDWWTYFTTQFVPKKSLVLDTLPIGYSDMKVIVYFLGSPDIEVGSFILGTSTYIGMLQQGAELDVVNFSTMERDLFGNALLVPRRSISSLTGELFITKEVYGNVMTIKEELDATPALWVGVDDSADSYYQSLLLFGIYRDFNFKLDNPIGATATLEIEEM